MPKTWIAWGALWGGLGVALGAFGAHILRPILPLQVMTTFETAVRYQMFHSLALVASGILMEIQPDLRPRLVWVARGFLGGLVLFSGSLYGLSLTGWWGFGPITPFGGALWIAAWGLLAHTQWKHRQS